MKIAMKGVLFERGEYSTNPVLCRLDQAATIPVSVRNNLVFKL